MAIIYISQSNTEIYQEQFECEQGISLYQALTAHGYSIAGATCGGAGVCRGCMVRIAEDSMECPACRYLIHTEELHVNLQSKHERQHILLYPEGFGSDHEQGLAASDYGIAIDLGTTTLASVLVELPSGKVLDQAGCMNPQAEYGADVISRIQYACEQPYGQQRMQDLILSGLRDLVNYYTGRGYCKNRIRRMIISGNTTMIHLLQGLSVQGLSSYPFTPEDLSIQEGQLDGIDYVTVPGRSAFIGGDITSGAAYLKLGQSENYDLFVDLGTNGELCLCNCDRGVCTSTACGPAFANSVMQGNTHGTTLLDQLALHYLAGDLDSDGLLREDLFDTGLLCGEFVITQDTIRQIQLAKSAIRTGIELAAYELRIPLDAISQVYLAGGFGFHLNQESAFTLGLFPEEFREKIRVVGNTSLAGAIEGFRAPSFLSDAGMVLNQCQILDLSMNKNFQEFFLHRLSFPNLI